MKRILFLMTYIIITLNCVAQAPQKMSYQAVIRNASNALVSNAPVKMRISILQGSATGTAVYSELHSTTTNANGLVSIEIGAGTSPQGTFSSINWANGTFYLKTETDPNNGTNYSIEGTSQLLSVPYALNSTSAGDGIKGVSSTGDTVFLNNGKKYIIPGIKDLNPPPTLNNGLVGFWPFNGNANDESGNNNNGTVNGATLTNDRFGSANKAYSFDGVTNRIDVEHSSSLSIFGNQSPSSISLWCYGNINWSGELIGKGFHSVNVGDYGNKYLSLTFDSQSYQYTLYNYSILNSVRCKNGFFNPNQWYHLVFIREPIIKVYVNGIDVSTAQNNSGWSTNYNLVLDNTIMSFGCRNVKDDNNAPFNNFFFNGKIDDIRIYNRALTQEEITYLANN